MRVQFNGQPAFDTNTMWGYTVEVTPEGVFGEVPNELVESEAAAGRIKVPAKAVKVEATVAPTEAPTEEPKRMGRPPKAVKVEATVAPTEATTEEPKRMGRPPKAAE